MSARTCADCGHRLDIHTPDGCVALHLDGSLCACPTPTPARPEGETPPCQCGHALNQHLLAGGHCEQRGCACRLFVIPLPPARERGEEDDPEISRVVDRIALHASGRNCDCVDNTQCNAELDRATERAIEIVTRLTARLAELEQALRAERERVVRWLLKDLIDGGEISGVRDEAGYIDACLARALAAAKGGA